MFPSNEHDLDVIDVVGAVRRKGVMLWVEQGQLRYRAPKGLLSAQELARLRGAHREILAYLDSERESPILAPRSAINPAPLTFSQLARWQGGKLAQRPTVRQIASATRLPGPLNVALLRECLSVLVQRHEALRTRILLTADGPVQQIDATGEMALPLMDLTHVRADAREECVARLIDELILEPIDVTVGPLFAVVLAKLDDEEHLLIAAMEHIISDAYSMNVVLRDLLTLYVQRSTGVPDALPPMSVQLADFAVWQHQRHKRWSLQHGKYWHDRLAGARRLRFPEAAPTEGKGWGHVRLRTGPALKRQLSEWCRGRRTTVVMTWLTAYAAVLLRWCQASECVIRFQTNGRIDPSLEHTVGFLAAALHLKVELLEQDSFLDLLARVTQEYVNAYEHHDCSYLDLQQPPPDCMGSSLFNWVSLEPRSGIEEQVGQGSDLRWSPVEFVNPVMSRLEVDSEPSILLYEGEHDDTIDLLYPRHRMHARIMERFARQLLAFMGAALNEPQQRIVSLPRSA